MFITIITFIIILGSLILVHELGHFITARMFKVKAEEFGFGLPPRIFGLVKNDHGKWRYVGPRTKAEDYKKTIWSVNWLPFGGFVSIKGENGDHQKDVDSFGSRKIWQRSTIMFAGVAMNFILCFVLLAIAFMVGIPSLVDDVTDPSLNASQEKVQIISVAKDSPAAAAQIAVGDIILKINGQPVATIQEVKDKISVSPNQEMDITISRANQEITQKIIPVSSAPDQPAQVGVGLVKTAIVRYPWYQAIYKGAETTLALTLAILKAFAKIIGDLITGQQMETEVAGPVGIAVLTGQVVKLGLSYILQFAALLSINLGIINLLPIPALDGGRLLFLIIEKFKGRPVKQSLEARIHQIGFVLLMCLMAFIILRDIKINLF
ncbi:RIP metalloprotease RseP [Candidatus Kuenenbacteria bacterium CG_4_9_14_3_um_filter_39_14]|uniref:Zinc metalloprotease n=6 Tax=Candidatus Kueneniibacteriota TaxID=1752740 RepID=A0A2M7ILQ3_9BACT|nr:MAG: RIP metalloprotease RseP [Candidatus Kuenenbacteria bacterium CG23_combo_of_CG06-09_8_20_14_all_39_39]PIR81167.1 MAG: RIP metalloprotease RseP [Candidatus Kuenenbacteria bacterium CG10_big_fil_rev_8_21_14_0_10_39_14]PIW95657.1 MAG: RIP metalloprotease RseP [Candidatus Kuenenbacteria bacterium CG_4_8_14_3_um_filter_39_15]PIX91973.1 MAG: RIP metalloprotease RseP [Candidatus Kuenenbacteria bacterium CG_4_10_14_3_um_filter_39_14]PJA91916.1 MAG: RIP metalloprotease RseP [Candidatus Kuenenbac